MDKERETGTDPRGSKPREMDSYNNEFAAYALVLAVGMALTALVIAAWPKAYISGFVVTAFAVYVAVVGLPAAVVGMQCTYERMWGRTRASAVMTVLTAASAAATALALKAGTEIPVLSALYETIASGMR